MGSKAIYAFVADGEALPAALAPSVRQFWHVPNLSTLNAAAVEVRSQGRSCRRDKESSFSVAGLWNLDCAAPKEYLKERSSVDWDGKWRVGPPACE